MASWQYAWLTDQPYTTIGFSHPQSGLAAELAGILGAGVFTAQSSEWSIALDRSRVNLGYVSGLLGDRGWEMFSVETRLQPGAITPAQLQTNWYFKRPGPDKAASTSMSTASSMAAAPAAPAAPAMGAAMVDSTPSWAAAPVAPVAPAAPAAPEMTAAPTVVTAPGMAAAPTFDTSLAVPAAAPSWQSAPVAPETPVAPEMPATPSWQSAPAAPEMPASPEMPAAPATPATPAGPEQARTVARLRRHQARRASRQSPLVRTPAA